MSPQRTGLTRRRLAVLLVWAGTAAAYPAAAWETNDWQFLESIQRANFRFFQEQVRGPYQLVNDTAPYDATYVATPDFSSVAGVGFDLTATCLGHYLGWISRSNAYERVLSQVRAFNNLLSEDPEVFERVNGWTFHAYWIDGPSAGKMFDLGDGLSLLDHSLFMGGCIFASEYFKGTEAGNLARRLYEETQWNWRPDGDYTGFGYSENLLSIVEAAEAPQFKKGVAARSMWNSLVVPWPRTLQLYFWQYPHCWVDFRFRTDDRGFNHVDVARDSILYMRQRAIDLHAGDAARYNMLGSNTWGWTAASSSEGYRQMAPWPLWLNGQLYDEEHASDSGSVTPFALPPCMIFAPTETMAAMKHIYEQFYINGWNPANGELPVWSERYGFLNCFNSGPPYLGTASNHFWGLNAAIDYGPNVLMLENYLRGTTWRYFMQHPSISSGMYTLGFTPPAWTTCATFSNQVNQFGGGLGSWHNDATPVDISFVAVSNVNPWVGDYAVRLVADSHNEGGWIDINGWDQRRNAELGFWLRSDNGVADIDVGLKDVHGRENKVNLTAHLGGTVPTNWTQVKIPLEAFTLTGQVTNDTWLGGIELVSFAFLNGAGDTLYIDALSFGPDTTPPRVPAAGFGVAQAGPHPRITWDPAVLERDVTGLHVWRRQDATSGFVRVTSSLVPAFRQVFEDTTWVTPYDREVRYAIQAYDNAEPQLSSLFTPEKTVYGGRFDVDWNNGRNPNTLGGSGDGYFGPPGGQSFDFVPAVLPDGTEGWVRRSRVSGGSRGHFVDLADGDLGAYAALCFYARGEQGGEGLEVGLRDAADHETSIDLAHHLPAGALETNWSYIMLPFSDFTGVNVSALRNISVTHAQSGTVYLARLAFLDGQARQLGADHHTEAEYFIAQAGSGGEDLKAGASNGEVLGQGWGLFGGSYAEYHPALARPMSQPRLALRYACFANDGRDIEVVWNDDFVGSLACTNTGGWGELSNHFRHASVALPPSDTGPHVLRFNASGLDDPVNLDCFTITDSYDAYRESEDFDAQAGSAGLDFKSGASGGEVLGQGWGLADTSAAVYVDLATGAQTGAWLHLWYALVAPSGRVVDVEIDGRWLARLPCAPTPGWGARAADFDRTSAFVGRLGPGTHTVQFTVPDGGTAVNLDAFYVGAIGPEGMATDRDHDGLSDRQEALVGTDSNQPDSDGDGIPDGDELLAAGRYDQVSDPTRGDGDGDGQNDLEESIGGTDPWRAASFFGVASVGPGAGGGVRLEWLAVTGRTYGVGYADGALSGGSLFQPVPDPENIVVLGTTGRYESVSGGPGRTYQLRGARAP